VDKPCAQRFACDACVPQRQPPPVFARRRENDADDTTLVESHTAVNPSAKGIPDERPIKSRGTY
jgi:hypothetical protein